MSPTTEQLFAVARDYWPSSMEAYLRPENCVQFERFQERWRRELARLDRWRTFLDELESDLPDFVIGDATATVDASFRCAVYPRASDKPSDGDWAVIGCMSILAPVYTVYGVRRDFKEGKPTSHQLFFPPLPFEWRTLSEVIARRIETAFNLSALSREVAEMSIPLCVDPLQPPDTTLFHALFTSRPQSLP